MGKGVAFKTENTEFELIIRCGLTGAIRKRIANYNEKERAKLPQLIMVMSLFHDTKTKTDS